jgi:hypothetical protein
VIIRRNIAAFEHAKQNNADIASLMSIKCYFDQLRYIIGQEQLDRNNVVTQFNNGIKKALSFPFKEVSEQFHLIESDQRTVVIEHDASANLCIKLRNGIRTKSLLRKIQHFSVNLYPREFDKLLQCGQIEVLDDSIAIMNMKFYDKKYGVSL